MNVNELLYAPISTNRMTNTSQHTNTKIPAIWINTLDEIRKICPEATIAGGALRDYFNGRPIKDIDIFVMFDDNKDLYRIFKNTFVDVIEVIHTDGGKPSPSQLQNGGSYPAHYQFYICDWLFEITQSMKPFYREDIIDVFDIGLCKIVYGNNDIVMHEDYKNDLANNTLTLLTEDPSAKIHAERIHSKYPDFTIRVPFP